MYLNIEKKKPNFIIIILDTLRASNLSIYGYKKKTTPFLSSLLKNCYLYKNAYSPATWTLPAHISILTGLYPSQHKVLHSNEMIDENIVTLPQFLKNFGYISKMYTSNPWLDEKNGFPIKFDNTYKFWDLYSDEKKFLFFLSITNKIYNKIRSKLYFRGYFDKGAKRLLEKIKRDLAEQSKPFFFLINFNETHSLYSPPKSSKHNFTENLPDKTIERISSFCNLEKYFLFSNNYKYKFPSEDELVILEDLYNEEILYTDQVLRKLWKIFYDSNIFENTIVFITSDHGESIGDHGFLTHEFSAYNKIIKVPLLIFFKNNSRRVIDSNIDTTTIFPTIIHNLIGDEKKIQEFCINHQSLFSNEFNNLSFSEFLKPIISEKNLKKLVGGVLKNEYLLKNKQKVIIKNRFKFIYNSIISDELYDLRIDPSELNNLGKIEKYKNLINNLKKEIITTLGDFKNLDYDSGYEKPELSSPLKSLGYL